MGRHTSAERAVSWSDEIDAESRAEVWASVRSILAFIGWALAFGIVGEVLIAGLIVLFS